MLRHFQTNYRKLTQPFIHKAYITFNAITKNDYGTHLFYDSPIQSVTIERNIFKENKLYLNSRQIWLENLNTIQEQKIGLVNLHPNIFGAQPRIDIIHENVVWQQLYRFISYANTKISSEVRGGGRKPWPQKGMGKARHGSIRSPLWRKGGIVHGPRSPTPYFYMLPIDSRVLGLTSTLSIKLAQDDLHLVSDLVIPTEDPSYILELIQKRKWGSSVLFVDNNDIMPEHITVATNFIKHINLMPAYSLNVYSILKHDSLVLTKSAVELIEEKLLNHLNRIDTNGSMKNL